MQPGASGATEEEKEEKKKTQIKGTGPRLMCGCYCFALGTPTAATPLAWHSLLHPALLCINIPGTGGSLRLGKITSVFIYEPFSRTNASQSRNETAVS